MALVALGARGEGSAGVKGAGAHLHFGLGAGLLGKFTACVSFGGLGLLLRGCQPEDNLRREKGGRDAVSLRTT